MHLPGVRSRLVDVPHVVGAVSARVIHETPGEVTVEYLVPTGGDFAGLGELDGFFKKAWKTFRKILPYAAPIAGAVIPQIFPESPWYVKAIPTAVAFAAPRKQRWQTVGLTAGATLASEGLRRWLRPAPSAPTMTGGSRVTVESTGQVVTTDPNRQIMQAPTGGLVNVLKEQVPNLLKQGFVLAGMLGLIGGDAGGAPPPDGAPVPPGGGPGQEVVYMSQGQLEPPRVLAVDPMTGQVVPMQPPGFFPPGPFTEFLPAPGAPPEAPAPIGAGQIPWGTVAMIGIPLAAVAMMARS